MALVGILMLLVILAMVAVLMAGVGSATQRTARGHADSEVALYSAEAGLSVALQEISQDPEYGGEAQKVPFGTNGQSYQVDLYDNDNPPPDGTVIPVGHTLVVATGWSRTGISRSVSALVSDQADTEVQDNALLAGELLDVRNGSLGTFDSRTSYAQMISSASGSGSVTLKVLGSSVTTFSGSFGSWLGGLINGLNTGGVVSATTSVPTTSTTTILTTTSTGATGSSGGLSGTTSTSATPAAHVAVTSGNDDSLLLGSGSSIDGEVRVPAGADANLVVEDQSGGAHAGIDDAYAAPNLVPVRMPLLPGTETLTVTTTSQLQPGAYGDLVVDGGVVELSTVSTGSSDQKNIYAFSSITLKNGGSILLKEEADAADVTSGLYVENGVDLQGGSIVNETEKPARVQLYVMDGGPVTMDIDQDSHAVLYAPGSDVDIVGGSLYGSVVGGNILVDNGAQVVYDLSLADLKPDPWGNGGFSLRKSSVRRR